MSQEPDIHVMPTDDCIDHEESMDCECHPEWNADNKKRFIDGLDKSRVIVHNRLKDLPQ